MRDCAWMLLLAGAAVLPGCASSRNDLPRAGVLEKYHVSAAEVTPAPALESGAASRPAEPPPIPRTAGPEEYVRIAMEQNPSVRRAQRKVLRLANRIPQATSLDDPFVSVAPIGEMAETAAGQVGLGTSVSQKLPFPGKLGTRGNIAGQDMAAAAQEVAETRVAVAADVRRAYWNFYYATVAAEITRRNRAVLGQFKDVATARFRAGTATEQDVLRVTVEISSLDNDLLSWDQKKATAAALLNSLLDRPVAATLSEPPEARLQSASHELDGLLADATEANPSLAKIKSQIEGDRERLHLARLQRWPDLTVSFTYNVVENQGLSPKTNGKDQWWLGFGVNIPLWFDKLDAAEREARNSIFEDTANLDDTRRRVDFRADALARADSDRKQALVLRDVIIPEAQQTLEVSLSDYRAGKVEFLTLVDNWRKLLNFQLLYQQGLTRAEQDFADLQQAVGHDLARPVERK